MVVSRYGDEGLRNAFGRWQSDAYDAFGEERLGYDWAEIVSRWIIKVALHGDTQLLNEGYETLNAMHKRVHKAPWVKVMLGTLVRTSQAARNLSQQVEMKVTLDPDSFPAKILFFLDKEANLLGLTVIQIAEGLRFERSRISRSLKLLEDRGIVRKIQYKDGSKMRIGWRITSHGESVVANLLRRKKEK